MEELDIQKIKTTYSTIVEGESLTLQTKVLANEEDDIGKVISVSSKACVDGISAKKGEIEYEGVNCVSIIYLDENGRFHTVKESKRFNGKIQNEKINEDTHAILKVTCLNNQIETVSPNFVEVESKLEVYGRIYVNEELNAIEEKEDEKMHLKKEEMFVNSVVDSKIENLDVVDKIKIDGKINKIISYNAWSRIKNITPKKDYFVIDGNVYFQAVYLIEDESELKTKTIFKKIEYSEEIENENISENSKINALSCVVFCESKAEIVLDGDNSEIKVQIPLKISYVVMDKKLISLPLDAYVEDKKTKLVFESYDKIEDDFSVSYDTVLNTSVDMNEENPVKQILATSGENIVISKVESVNSNEVLVEGICFNEVVYEVYDDLKTIKSLQIEIPFSEKIPFEHFDSTTIFANAILSSVDYRLVRGKEILATLSVSFSVNGVKNSSDAILSNIEIESDNEERKSKLQMYFASAEMTLWDTAKMCGVSEELILEQNPNLEFPLKDKERIIVFK